uniref:Cilia and flagella associated protein 161 n=1 Tax=Microcebus murinus TaxID=30608 RepID=A0A8C5YBY8_MICMU
ALGSKAHWNEDIYLEEERLKDFIRKRDEGELLIQRSRRLKKTLLRPTRTLPCPKDGYVHYSDKVMLVNPDYPEKEADVMTPDEIHAHLCGTSYPVPVSRNTFTILSMDGNNTRRVLRYGQDFCLGITAGSENKMLYLSSDHRTFLKSAQRSWLQEVYLTDEVSYRSCWQAALPDPQLRLESEGCPVPANARVIITHSHTNRRLAAHRHLFLRTYFGKEAEVAAHTHLDPHRVEKPRNHWMLVTGNPRGDSPTMLDLHRPLAGDTRAVEPCTSLNTQ